jgi:hypothetical protein
MMMLANIIYFLFEKVIGDRADAEVLFTASLYVHHWSEILVRSLGKKAGTHAQPPKL